MVFLARGQRKLVHHAGTAHLTAEWVARGTPWSVADHVVKALASHGADQPMPPERWSGAMMNLVVHSFGYLAAILVFCTFYMRTMLPLRCVAIASNVAFLTYGLPLGLWPVAVLHALLLPVNILRLLQIGRMMANVRRASISDIDVGPLMSSLTLENHAQGTVLYHKDDWGDRAYFIAKGEIDFPELGVKVGAGQLFGEFAIFSPKHTRTASAVCATDVVLYRVDEQAFVLAFHHHPSFAFALMRLVMRRSVDNLTQLETSLKTFR